MEYKLKRARILLCVLAVLFIISLVETIYLWNNYELHAQTYYEAGYNDGLGQKALQTQAETHVYTWVYVTGSGEKYHEEDCRYVNDSSKCISLEDAINRGYTPCSVCNPPRP